MPPAQRLRSEPHEIRGAGDAERREENVGRGDERGDACTRCDGPRDEPGDHAGGGADTVRAAAEERVADDERGVRPRRADDDECDPDERDNVTHASENLS